MNKQNYDIIGDIHGHADELQTLLTRLGYENGLHPEGRKVIFLGDLIDRGPKIREVLNMVRGMVENGNALLILGNHEVNAIRYHTLGNDGEYLRPRSVKNTKQHQATLDQFPDSGEWAEWIDWLSGQPLSLDLGGLRAVHASWDDAAIKELRGIGKLGGETLHNYSRKGTPQYDTISRILNGPEAEFPDGYSQEIGEDFRPDFRVKWWLKLEGRTCRETIFPADANAPDLPPKSPYPSTSYPEDGCLTFFGHYALKEPVPAPIRHDLACLDYGAGKGGFLCAYRWDGEAVIDPTKFVTAA